MRNRLHKIFRNIWHLEFKLENLRWFSVAEYSRRGEQKRDLTKEREKERKREGVCVCVIRNAFLLQQAACAQSYRRRIILLRLRSLERVRGSRDKTRTSLVPLGRAEPLTERLLHLRARCFVGGNSQRDVPRVLAIRCQSRYQHAADGLSLFWGENRQTRTSLWTPISSGRKDRVEYFAGVGHGCSDNFWRRESRYNFQRSRCAEWNCRRGDRWMDGWMDGGGFRFENWDF